MILALAIGSLILAVLPATVAALNLMLLRSPQPGRSSDVFVSILVPARNEADVIASTIEAALASRGVAVEVLVGDDHSTDDTAAIVHTMASADRRLRLVPIPDLPDGWTGKNHACAILGAAAGGSHLLFADADVRLAIDTAARLHARSASVGAALVSGVPRQIMPTLGERLTVPMINWLMIGFLPVAMMRARPHDPSLGVACGQLVLVERHAYRAMGGHGAFRASLHDGLRLPRMLRESGYTTDLVAAHELAHCRMYSDFTTAWAGFSKNAHEGMATPRALPIWTLLLAGGQIAPWLLLPIAWSSGETIRAMLVALVAVLLSLATRAAITMRVREPLSTVALHPFAVIVALAIQWNVLLRRERAGAATWKGRRYPVG